MPRHAVALVVAALATVLLSGTSLAAASGRPKPGRYVGTTSEQGRCLEARNYSPTECRVTFEVADHGKRVTGFTTADGDNGMCQWVGSPDHVFEYLVKVPLMKVRSNGSFTGTAKARLFSLSGTFRVKGRLSSGTVRGTVTRIGATCGSDASNATTSDYLETFVAKRT